MLNYQTMNDPLLLLIGGGAGADSFDMVAPLVGWRVRRLPLDEASAAEMEMVAARCVAVELDAVSDGAAEAVLDAIRTRAAAGRGASLVAFPFAEMDRVTGVLTTADAELLCEPADEDRVRALTEAHRGATMLHDAVGEAEAERLQRLTEEVGRIARALAALSRPPAESRGRPDAERIFVDADGVDAGVVRAMIRLRRLREQFFDAALFADPAWDMLLDLTAARAEGRSVAVSSLCIAAAVPPTTALRWISTMTEAGLLVRRSDPLDKRRVFMTLSDEAAGAMAAYLRAAMRAGAAVAA